MGLFLPFTANVYEKVTVLTTQKEQIRMMSNWQEQLADIQKKQDLIDQGIQQMMVDIASERELSKIIEQFYDASEKTYISLAKIQPTQATREGGYLIQGMEVEASGSYHSLARFVNQLERSGMLVEVQSMNLEQGEVNSSGVKARLLFDITLAGGSGG